jgi:CheY-like chemotaxis protein
MKRRIVVVEDYSHVADSMARWIRRLGHDVRTATDGASALLIANEFRPDTMLVDIGLPELNGAEVARRIRDESWGETILLVAMSGWTGDEIARLMKDAGFDGYLSKPIDNEQLTALLDGIVPCGAVLVRQASLSEK